MKNLRKLSNSSLEEDLELSKRGKLLDYGVDDPLFFERVYELERLRRYREDNAYDSRHMKSLRNRYEGWLFRKIYGTLRDREKIQEASRN